MGATRAWVLGVLATSLIACAADPAPGPTDGASGPDAAADSVVSDAGGDADAATGPSEAHLLQADFAAMREAMLAYLAAPQRMKDGDWVGDYGDAPMYGPSFDLRWWQLTGDAAHLERALAALAWNLALVEEITADPIRIATDMEQVAMAVMGLLEAGQHLDDDRYHVAADGLIALIDELSLGLDDYLDVSVGRFAANTYGPTAISAFVALLHLQHALSYPGHDAAAHLARADAVLDAIHGKAWDDGLAAYAFEPGAATLHLYPNITNMLANARAAELTGEARYLERFRTLYAGIQPLKAPAGDHYYSPYSAAYMGATDEDYATLSSQNYLMLALFLGWRLTGEAAWLDEIGRILGFLRSHLLHEGQLLHHWMNGGPAIPTDKEYYCSGCNLQTLYLLSLMSDAP